MPIPRTARRMSLLLAALPAAALLSACAGAAATPAAGGGAAPAQADGITYTVTATSPAAAITYVENTGGSLKSLTTSTFPWSTTVDIPSRKATIIATMGIATGSVTCTISAPSGRVLTTATASGQGVVAACDGSRP